MDNGVETHASVPTDAVERQNHACGYTRIGIEDGDGSYHAGYSLYSAVWPLLQDYPGHKFQSGLFGTWMFADSVDPKLPGLWFYSTIEGGLGWWRDTEYPTTTPKFIMGAVAVGFSAWANGPSMGKGRDWSNPCGHYGVAQLSPNLLWPPDGVNLKQGTCGDLLGYGYLPLPLTEAKTTTAGKAVPTGDQCWTLFMNAANFKGPATFVIPYFFSGPSVKEPRLAGKFLDSCPPRQNRTHSMETQYIPWAEATDARGRRFARMAPTTLPASPDGKTVVLHQASSYSKTALWNRVKTWLAGGTPADSRIDREGTFIHQFNESRGVEWRIWEPDVPRNERIPIDASEFVRPALPDPFSLAYAAQSELVTYIDTGHGKLLILPEYYHRIEEEGSAKWVAVAAEAVPAETGLHTVNFNRPEEPPPHTYVTPDDPESCWKKPGPVAGPFVARPGDGSEVTYYWYRFADQPALLNADMSDAEREKLQERVEKIHRHWTKDREYLAPPKTGTLAEIDPALIVTPPVGLEIGYVPIATRQGMGVC